MGDENRRNTSTDDEEDGGSVEDDRNVSENTNKVWKQS